MVVPSTVACVLVVYSVLLVIVVKSDQHDDRKSDVVRLVDNSPFDRQKYYVSLETGFRKGAGTSAQVGHISSSLDVDGRLSGKVESSHEDTCVSYKPHKIEAQF